MNFSDSVFNDDQTPGVDIVDLELQAYGSFLAYATDCNSPTEAKEWLSLAQNVIILKRLRLTHTHGN